MGDTTNPPATLLHLLVGLLRNTLERLVRYGLPHSYEAHDLLSTIALVHPPTGPLHMGTDPALGQAVALNQRGYGIDTPP